MSAALKPLECTSRMAIHYGSCIHALAAGWITSSDLCPECTQVFMDALNAEVPDLRWHPNYVARLIKGLETER